MGRCRQPFDRTPRRTWRVLCRGSPRGNPYSGFTPISRALFGHRLPPGARRFFCFWPGQGCVAVRALLETRVLPSLKSVLDPVQLVFFPGKALNLATRTTACHTQAVLQLWVGWMQPALWGRQWAAPPQLPGPATLACAHAWFWVPFCGRGLVLEPMWSDGGRGAETELGPPCQSARWCCYSHALGG